MATCYRRRVDDPDKSHLFDELSRLVVLMLRLPGYPSLKEAEAAVRGAVARAAHRATGENVSRAAELLGVGRATFRRALRYSPMVGPAGIRDHGAMHAPFDDTLFPFVRVLWPAEPTKEWADEYIAWATEVIIPRARNEAVRIVNLENWSAIEGLSGTALSQVKYLTEQMGGDAGDAGGGVIFYAPNTPIASLLGPIINMVPVPLKIAATQEKVVKHAIKLFQKANTSPPASIHLD